MTAKVQITSPATLTVVAERTLATPSEAAATVARANAAQAAWAARPLSDRIAVVQGLVDAFLAKRDEIAHELATLIGRPLRHCHNELNGFKERATHLLSIAPTSLAPTTLPEKPNFHRSIHRAPLGTILIIAAWNYPYLIMANGFIPALLAGNTVVIKQAPQTLPTAERLSAAAAEADIPDVLVHLHAAHDVMESVIASPLIHHIHFTGSVRGGKEVQLVAARHGRLVSVGLELGGKDPAYVRGDIGDVRAAVENVLDGAFYNAGQSCCAVERAYVHESIYDEFCDLAREVAEGYVVGGPFDDGVGLGPVVGVDAASRIREHVDEAVARGARRLVDEGKFAVAKSGTAFVAPQVLVDVDHTMRIMTEETFGPVVGVMKVSSDEEAIRLMNDSQFGLTASVWTKDVTVGEQILQRLNAGTVFLNRCDYLDPALPWCGWKDSGRGVTLSHLGFDAVTKSKAYHIKLAM